MALRSFDPETDPTSLSIAVAAKLTDEIAKAEFEAAMQDPDGVVLVRLVEERRRMDNEAHQEELIVLRRIIDKYANIFNPTTSTQKSLGRAASRRNIKLVR